MFSIQLPVNNPVATIRPTFGDVILSNDLQHASEFDLMAIAVDDNLKEFILGSLHFIPEELLVSFNAEELSFLAEDGIENIVTVTIDRVVYQLGYEPLEVGEFTFNPDTRKVVVKLRQPMNINSVVSYKGSSKYQGTPGLFQLRSTKICRAIEPFLLRWNINGSITINHNFGDHSSFSFSFAACKDRVHSINRSLSNGTIITAFGQKWVIDGVATTLIKDSDEIAVTVNLKDWLAPRGTPSKSPLDNLSKLKNGNASLRSLSEFAHGVGYRGAAISVRAPKNTSSEETTTVRELAESRAITKHCFVFYGQNGLEIRSWGNTRLHVINQTDVRDDITIQMSGHGSEIDKVKLHTEYRNMQVNLDFDPDTADKKQGVTERWVFENCQDLGDLYSAAEDHGFYYKQPDPQVLRNPGINFDAGGRTKKATRIIELNGTVTFEQTFEAGYAFSSAEVYRVEVTPAGNYIIRFDDPDPQNFWKVVRQSTTDHIYDSDGYLKAIRVSGTELARLQQESEKLEAVNFLAQAIINPADDGGISIPDPSFMAQANAYKFDKSLPINDTTTYQLDKLANYFDDTVKPSDRCDPDFVEPKFMALKIRNAQSFIKQANPKNTEEYTYPEIVTGKFLTEVERNTITSTTFPFKFEHRTSAQNSEGEYAKNAIALGTTTQNIGKPGLHFRLDNKLDPLSNGDNGNSDRYANQTFYLNSPGVNSTVLTNEGSKSYPDIDDPNEVRAIAETELSIINTQNSLTASVNIHWRGDLEVGDRVVFLGKTWVIFSIQDSRSIEQGSFNSTSMQLSLGRLLKPSLNLDNRSSCSGGNSISPVIVDYGYGYGYGYGGGEELDEGEYAYFP